MNKLRIYRELRASTLAELLVVMLTAGIVMAAVMEGIGLFSRYTSGLVSQIVEGGRMRESYYVLDHLVTSADSVTVNEGRVTTWRSGVRSAVLYQRDSMLLIAMERQPDTLFTGVASFGVIPEGVDAQPDSISLTMLHRGRTIDISFPVLRPDHIIAREDIMQTERGYEYH